MTRRELLWHLGGGLGGVALASLLTRDGLLAGPHHPPKAKRVVHLFMAGGASHLDLRHTLRDRPGERPPGASLGERRHARTVVQCW